MIKEIDLLLIKPNPYQTRRSEDPAHVIKLADSILKNGMLQIPAGRMVVDGAGMDYYQLAFGHSRYAAYCLLDANGNPGFATMPLNISELDDLQMFEQAVIENSQRKDINPIEQARAMVLYRDMWHKTSVEIGKLFGGLDDSTVRNKMRLLKLPEDLQDSLAKGEMTEGCARALVPVYELPAEKFLKTDMLGDASFRFIIEAAKSGEAPSHVSKMVGQLIDIIDNMFQEELFNKKTREEIIEQNKRTNELYEAREKDKQAAQAAEAARQISQAPAAPVAEEADPFDDKRPDTGWMPNPTPLPTPAKPDAAPAPAQPADAAVELADDAEAEAPETAETPAASDVALVPQPAIPLNTLITWESSTITCTLTLWPDDGNPRGRMVMVAARLNTDAPKMAMVRQADIIFPSQVQNLIDELRNSFGGQQ